MSGERIFIKTILGSVFAINLCSNELRAQNADICSQLELPSKDIIVFTKTEKNLLCGDPDNEPWSAPPVSQIKVFMSSFLQSRGYFQPVFIQQEKILVVEPGKKSKVHSLVPDDIPPELDFDRFWVPWNRTLMPSLLDEYEDLVRGRIEAEGYPCPKVKMTADAGDGSVVVHGEAGPRQRVIAIQENDDLGLRPGTLRRYFPIREGDWYDGDLVHIANERLKAAEILGGSYMVTTCEPGGAVIHHRSVVGPPRRMTAGVGLNTETFALARVTYHSARLDANASNFDALLSVNYLRQHVESSFEWYFLTTPSPLHFKPILSFDRINEESSEERTTKGSWHLGAYWDIGSELVRSYVGPNLNLIRTLRGVGPNYARILEMEANARVMSHGYEFYRGAPRTGHLIDLRYTTASERTYSTLNVRTYSAKGTILFNMASLEPPLLVIGFRANIAGTDADPDVELPDQYLYYIGGSDDVRGFRRRTVPSSKVGARSILSGGTELRLVTVIPYGIQPIIFMDAGQLGTRAFSYESTIYYSPGFGVRWQSPFGGLRGSIARGMVQTNSAEARENFPTRWNAFVSFGEEF